MHLIAILLFVTAFPLACLGFLLWMARLEDSLPAAVRATARRPDPPPILAIPVRTVAPDEVAPVIALPARRSEPPQLPAPAPTGQTGSPLPPAAAAGT